MSSEATYYVPESSRLPLWASIGLITTVFGAAHWLNGTTFLGMDGMLIFFAGALFFAGVLFNWFSTVIRENLQGLPNAQLKRSYVWGITWFIFSEVMFFFAFFLALFYVRNLAVPWLGGEGDKVGNDLLWEGFKADWPLMQTPDQVVNGDAAKYIAPHENMSFPGWSGFLHWLPFWNTVILLTSSWTVHIAHTAMKNGQRSKFNLWLGITVVLGILFLILQVEEYHEAYTQMGLTLQSGIYGTTFFMLTGFHGAHVTMGTIMLLIQLLRSFKGHFKPDDQFGFEASSWYWHFVDVVWVCLFIFVYVV